MWKSIPSLPGYFANSNGHIRWGSSGPVLKGSREAATGYWRINLRRGLPRPKRFRVNRLICEAFHGPAPSMQHEAAHNDHDLDNNRPANLRWATRKQNVADQIEAGTFIRGSRHPLSKLAPDQVLEIRASDLSHRLTAKRFGISKTLVGNIRRGITWKHIPHNNAGDSDA